MALAFCLRKGESSLDVDGLHHTTTIINDFPAIITPDISTDPALSVADHPDTGEDESEQVDDPQSAGQPDSTDIDKQPQGQFEDCDLEL